MLLRTVPLPRTSRLGQYWQKTFVDVFTPYCNISRQQCPFYQSPNNLFLDGFNTSPGWLLVTRTRGAWWCRYRGHCRSRPRHLSPRSRVCAQEWHWKDIHSHIHSHTPTHTPKKAQKQQQQNAQLTKHDAFVYWSSSCAVCWWPIFRKLGTTTDVLSARTLLTENICESVQQILQLSPAEKKKKRKKKNAQLTKHDAFLYWSSSCPMWWWATARKLVGCYSGLFHFRGLLA